MWFVFVSYCKLPSKLHTKYNIILISNAFHSIFVSTYNFALQFLFFLFAFLVYTSAQQITTCHTHTHTRLILYGQIVCVLFRYFSNVKLCLCVLTLAHSLLSPSLSVYTCPVYYHREWCNVKNASFWSEFPRLSPGNPTVKMKCSNIFVSYYSFRFCTMSLLNDDTIIQGRNRFRSCFTINM